MTIIQVKL